MSKSKMSVVGLINGLNKKSSSSSKITVHHNNPLFNSHPQERASPIKKHMQFPKPTSPIMKKTFITPGSPIKYSPKIIAGSPMRVPLSPKNTNLVSPPSKPSPNKDTPRPLSSAFHQNLNQTLRNGPRRSTKNTSLSRGSPLRSKRATSMYSPTSREVRLARSLVRDNIQIPPSLPPPPKIPTDTFPLPGQMGDIPPSTTPQTVTLSDSKLISSVSMDNLNSIDETIERIQRKSTRQMDLAVYQSIQLFCCSPLHHRSTKILECLLQFNTKQLVQHIFSNMNTTHDITNRRNAVDTLSSLVLYKSNSPGVKKDLQVLIDTLSSPKNLQVLLTFMKDEDIVIRSYMTGVLAALHIEPSLYLGNATTDIENSNENHTYSFNGIPKIIHLLGDRNHEVKEAALTALICLGPVAASAVHELAGFLLKEKSPQLRILACQALNEIGTPYALPAVGKIQEIARKDKEESVKIVAQNVLDRLKRTCNVEGSYEASCQENKLIIDEAMVKKAISESQLALKGSPVNVGDLKQYFTHCYPNISSENPSWKQQLRDTLRDMVCKGLVTKTPATFTLA